MPGDVPMKQLFTLCLFFAVLFVGAAADSAVAQVKAKDQRIVDQVSKSITKAGELFKDQDFEKSAKLIGKSEKRLLRLAEKAEDGELWTLLKKQHQRLSAARDLLASKGVELDEIAPLPELKQSPPEAVGVSFVSQVAPIINAKCGRCHVAAARGQFSARSFQALMQSTTVTPQMADESRLIEVIVNGEMPKGGLKVEPAELEILKKWIAEGAKFDGQDRSDLISAAPAPTAAATAIRKPTGKETVSFAEHVAPVLQANCGRCHMTRNPRGNFDMANFRSFNRGGDSGAPVVAGNSAGSNLIKRLRGVGGDVMPPSGKLDDKLIDNIAKWIDEGGSFDAADATLSMQALAAKGRSASMSHDELAASRLKESKRIWKLVMSDGDPVLVKSENFNVMGVMEKPRLDSVAKIAQSLVEPIQKSIGTTDKEHFLRGNATVFLLERRYDFSEFGTMIVKREFPAGVGAWWDHNVTAAWTSVYLKKGIDQEKVRVLLARQLASLHVADISPSVPRWFADGLGYSVAAKMFKKDPVVVAWETAAASASSSMQRKSDFLTGNMDQHQAGLVSFAFVQQLRKKNSSFKRLMGELNAGANFDAAFTAVYKKSPSDMVGW